MSEKYKGKNPNYFSFNEVTTEQREAGLDKLVGSFWGPKIKEGLSSISQGFDDAEHISDVIEFEIMNINPSTSTLREQGRLNDKDMGVRYSEFECKINCSIGEERIKDHIIKIKVLVDFSRVFYDHPLVHTSETFVVDHLEDVYFDSAQLIS
jgi:hypothetical protein